MDICIPVKFKDSHSSDQAPLDDEIYQYFEELVRDFLNGKEINSLGMDYVLEKILATELRRAFEIVKFNINDYVSNLIELPMDDMDLFDHIIKEVGHKKRVMGAFLRQMSTRVEVDKKVNFVYILFDRILDATLKNSDRLKKYTGILTNYSDANYLACYFFVQSIYGEEKMNIILENEEFNNIFNYMNRLIHEIYQYYPEEKNIRSKDNHIMNGLIRHIFHSNKCEEAELRYLLDLKEREIKYKYQFNFWLERNIFFKYLYRTKTISRNCKRILLKLNEVFNNRKYSKNFIRAPVANFSHNELRPLTYINHTRPNETKVHGTFKEEAIPTEFRDIMKLDQHIHRTLDNNSSSLSLDGRVIVALTFGETMYNFNLTLLQFWLISMLHEKGTVTMNTIKQAGISAPLINATLNSLLKPNLIKVNGDDVEINPDFSMKTQNISLVNVFHSLL